MKKHLFLFLLTVVLAFSVFAENEEYIKILKKVDDLVFFGDTDLSAEYTIIKKDPNGSSSRVVANMFRRDRQEKFLILIVEPLADKGKGYLKLGKNLWLYDPFAEDFTFTSAKERFENSGFRLSDFTGSDYAKNYDIISVVEEQLGKFKCKVFDLQAKNNSVSFPREKIWVSEDNLVRKIEDYSLSNQLMRTSAVPSYQKVNDRWVPITIQIQDNMVFREVADGKKVYERTTVTIKNPSLNKQPDSLYTKEYLERINTKND